MGKIKQKKPLFIGMLSIFYKWFFNANEVKHRLGIETKLNAHKRMYNVSEYPGTCHGDELCYIFR